MDEARQVQALVAQVAPSVTSFLRIAEAGTAVKFSSLTDIESNPWIAAFRLGYVLGTWRKWVDSRAPGNLSADLVSGIVLVSAAGTADIAFGLGRSPGKSTAERFLMLYRNTAELPNAGRGFAVGRMDVDTVLSGRAGISFSARLNLADIKDEAGMVAYGLPAPCISPEDSSPPPPEDRAPPPLDGISNSGQSEDSRKSKYSPEPRFFKAITCKGFRDYAALAGSAPSSKMSDDEVFAIYEKIMTAFSEVAMERREKMPSGAINAIALKFMQLYELGKREPAMSAMFEPHFQYELDRYRKYGLRAEYKDLGIRFDVPI